MSYHFQQIPGANTKRIRHRSVCNIATCLPMKKHIRRLSATNFCPCPRHGRADFTAKHKNPEKWTFVRFISKPALLNSHDRSYISDSGRIQTHDT